ncbi:glycosyltransferase family 2 protein [Epilithonimonas vandammei]|uniref:Glycosyltransferase family 2 protein n=1 Tax=Epilithonimonas vandammei TaxID=2487072 RepID=A0A3G8ZIC5_9FLAO|nr:glycosyltransferase family 2 protein [Epilithonimonas vandammei]AZI56565.1 glycosyltransferase family 2 protein [Epilithonimonas vandammei]
MDVSIIIVNYNTLKMTKECIDTIFKYTNGLHFEVILVDNASEDGSKDFFGKDDRVTYIYSEQNLGFGRANNLGYEKSNGRYIFLLNSDTLLIENSVLHFFHFMEKFSSDFKIGACGCILVDINLQQIHSYGYFPSVRMIFKDFLVYSKKILRIKKGINEQLVFNENGSIDVDYITGADLFLRKEYIENLSTFFESDYFMYYEETDLQYRMAVQGYKRCIINNTKIIHLEGGSLNTQEFKKKSVFKFYNTMLPSMYLFLNKNYKPIRKLTYLFAFNLLVFPKILLKKMTFEERIKLISLNFKKNNL